MTDDNLYSPYEEPERPKWQIGKLSNGSFSHEDFWDLAQSFLETEPFLDAIGYIFKRVDFVFGLREMNADAYRSFLDPPPHEAAVAAITKALSAVYLEWKIASDLNPAVASFNGEMLESLRNEIHRVNRDAIDAACNGTEAQKSRAAYHSREDLTNAFYRLQDDNPTVAGKGIEYLRRNGIAVHMFAPEFQKVIAEENRTFFEWARQQTEKPKLEVIKLSEYEDPLPAVQLNDLSQDALERYRLKADIKPSVGSPEFVRLLQQHGLLTIDGDHVTPTGFGFLLFGVEPRNALQQAGLLARAELGNGQSSREEFNQAMVLIPDAIEEWLKKILPSTLDRSRMERREQVDLPFEMIREAVVNALIHRDYDIKGQKCQLIVNVDTITIKSPGGPVSPITLEQLRSFNAPMKSRNPILHYVFARMCFAEEQGYGLSSLKKHAEELRLPLPTFSMEGESLVLTIYRSKDAAIAALPDDVLKGLTVDEVASWGWIVGRESITTGAIPNCV